MLKLKPGQRALLAETLRDIANLAAGAMVFGQFLSDRVFSSTLALCGLGVWMLLVAYAVALAGRNSS